MPQFQRLVRKLWDLLQECLVTIEIHWVASKFNPADLPSRQRWSLSRTALSEATVDFIMKGFPQDWMDWMACCDTTQCPKFVAEGPQPPVPGVTLPADDIFSQRGRLRELLPGWWNLP